MHFLTSLETREWCTAWVPFGPDGYPERPHRGRQHVKGPVDADTGFCRVLERALQPHETCILWVTGWGIWRSSENLHLYYRLRQSYGDGRLLSEAPVHLFLDYESADLVTFLQIGILNGWDMHLIPDASGYARAFVSHDEFFEFAADEKNQALATALAADLPGARLIAGDGGR